MTIRAYDVGSIRSAEALVLAQVPEGALMQRAAAGLATACAGVLRRRRGRVTGARIVVLAGAGNNGGDALWAGARLAGRGGRVDALLLAPSAHAEGLAALHAAGGRSLAVPAGAASTPDGLRPATRLLAAADLVVDGIVGLGGAPGLREPAARLVAALDELAPRPAVVAVDLPSGVDADGGTTPAPHVRADLTVTFGAAKPCLLVPPAARAAGEVQVVDIGLGPCLPPVPAVDRLTPDDVDRLWPVPGPADDKYSRGVVGVVAGSAAYPGAAVLTTGGALRAGAGMVRYVGPAEPTSRVRARWPEVVTGPGRVQAWALGSGVDPDDDGGGQPAAVREALAQALEAKVPAVVDAGALALLARPDWRRLAGPHLLLTPHAGELARLLGSWGEREVARQDV
ncbi:MAG TPA: NAD(P)H-hydrate epimerase, partial [Kineosporiaceae bacterium]